MKSQQQSAASADLAVNDSRALAAGKQTLTDTIYRQDDPTAGALDPSALLSAVLAVAAETETVRRAVDPDGTQSADVTDPAAFTERLRGLAARLDELRPAIDGVDPARGGNLIRRSYAEAQDAIVAAYQTLAVYHADATLDAWAAATPADRTAQRNEFQRASRIGDRKHNWCGMFANSQFRAAGMHGALNMVFNSQYHAAEFFRYGSGSSNNPQLIQPHGAGAEVDVRAYHEQRGSLRSWKQGAAVGDDLRPGDIVTLDWFGTGTDENDAETQVENRIDHVSIVRSYTPPSRGEPGRLVTIDGNAYGILGAGMAALSGNNQETDLSTSTYETGPGTGREVPALGQNAGPAFNRDAMLAGNNADVWHAMSIYGRGRPSLVDFEPDHIYPGYSGRTSEGPPAGVLQRSDYGAITAADPGAAFDRATAEGASEIPYRDEMQQHFGADFSSVRAYLGRDLGSLGAHAAARGDHVAFASSAPDRETVAHELTHVMQARNGSAASGGVSSPGDASEHEARSVASAVASGRRLQLGGVAPSAAIHRQDGPRQPPAVQPEPNQGAGGARLDWDEFYGISATLPNGALGNSIREHYELALLIHLPALIPEVAPPIAIPATDDRQGDAAGRRHAAVDALGNAIVAEQQARLAAGDRDGAERIRIALFTANQYAIVDALQVESSLRYDQVGDKTFCNVYAYDVVTALGGYLPRSWWRPDAVASINNGARVVTQDEYTAAGGQWAGEHSPLVTNTETYIVQLNANEITQWMRDYGIPGFGWRELTGDQRAPDAQAAANGGHIVILLGRKADAALSGHVSVLLAESQQHARPTQTTNNAYVPLQSQAGADNVGYSDGAAGVGTAAREAWWSDPSFADAGFFVYEGTLSATFAIASPERLGTRSAG